MRRKILPVLLAVACWCAGSVSGAELGERIDRFAPKYLLNEPAAAIRFDAKLSEDDAKRGLVLVDFFGSYWPSGNLQGELLNAMADAYAPRGLRVVALSGEPQEKLRKFIEAGGEIRFAVAWDNQLELSQRILPGNVILPFCAILDGRGVLLWFGETGEVPDVLERIYAGTYDRKARAELLPYYAELAAALRGASTNEIVNITERMLGIEPANLSAAQARLFILESNDKAAAAWDFLRRRLERSKPDHLWFALAVGFGARNPEYRDRVLPYVAQYPERFGAVYAQEAVSMAWELASYYSFNLEALQCAEQLLDAANAAGWRTAACRALIAYHSCRAADALRWQREAVALATAAGSDDAQLNELRGILAFFERLQP